MFISDSLNTSNFSAQTINRKSLQKFKQSFLNHSYKLKKTVQ